MISVFSFTAASEQKVCRRLCFLFMQKSLQSCHEMKINQILAMCLLSAPTGAAQLKVETTATQPELSSEAKPNQANSITSSVLLSDQKNLTEKSDQKVVTIENSASAAPCDLPTTTSLSEEKKPLTPDNEIHDFDGRHIFHHTFNF